MASLGYKGKFRQNGEYEKKSLRVWPNIQMRWQTINEMTVGDFYKND